MLKQCLYAENAKIKSSIIWFLFLILPILPAVFGTFNYLGNLDILTDGWYSLWTQHTLFYADFFYAPLIAIYASYLWRLEHLNHNWNAIMTAPVPTSSLFLAKFLILFKMTVLTQIWVGILFFLSGKLVGLSGMMPPVFLFWLLRGCFGGIGIIALSLLLSMMIRSYSVPILIALGGSVASLSVLSEGKGYLWPYSLMMLGMNANSSENSMETGYIPFLIATIFFFLLFTTISIIYLKKKDVCSA